MKSYQAVIFDVGDTLVKWFPSWAEVYTIRLRAAGVAVDDSYGPMISSALYRAEGRQKRKEQHGTSWLSDEAYFEMLDRAALSSVPELPEPIEILVEKMKSIPLPKQKMKVIPGVHSMLDRLKNAEYRMAVVSNHWTWLYDFLKDENLIDYFETVVISQVVGVSKPNVKIMQIALEKMGLAAQDCLYVGDHEMDVLCSKQAGLDMAWIAPPDAVLVEDIEVSEDYRIPSVLDLPVILQCN